jgi:hypothetical protein
LNALEEADIDTDTGIYGIRVVYDIAKRAVDNKLYARNVRRIALIASVAAGS